MSATRRHNPLDHADRLQPGAEVLLIWLPLAFLFGVGLAACTLYLTYPYTGAFPLLHNLFRLGWIFIDALGGDGYGLTEPGLMQLATVLMGGVVLTVFLATLDLVAGRLLRRRLRIALWALGALLFVILLVTPSRPPVISLSYDGNAAAEEWFQFTHFMQDRDALGRRHTIYSGIATEHFPEVLTHRAFPRSFEMLILSGEFEKAWNPELLEPLEPIARLANNPIVLATADAAVAAGLEADSSMAAVLQRVRAGEWGLLHLDAAQDAVGLAALLLTAGHSKAPLLPEGPEINLLRPQYGRLVSRSWYNVSPRATTADESVARLLQKPSTIAILDNARCGELVRAGVPLRGFFPADGTFVLDHPVYLNPAMDAQRREQLLDLVSWLQSPKAQEWKAHTMLGSRCAEGEPHSVLPYPPIAEVRALLDQWQAPAAKEQPPQQ